MRSFSSVPFINTFTNPNGFDIKARLTIYKSRVFFELADLTSRSPVGWLDVAGISESYNRSTVSYHDATSMMYTAYADTTYIKFLRDDSSVPYATTIPSNAISRPGFVAPYLYEYSAGNINLHTLDMAVIKSGTGTYSISYEAVVAIAFSGVVHAISGTEFVYMYIDDGGVGIKHYTKSGGTWTASTYPYRIMMPSRILSAADLKYLNFSAAVKSNDAIFCYMSMDNGSVVGIKHNSDGFWEDQFEAIPADLTRFFVCNATTNADGRIFLSGQFTRTEEFATNVFINLMFWSDNGSYFSLDRHSAFSSVGYRFQVAFDPTGKRIFYTDANTYYVTSGPYSVFGSNTSNTLVDSSDIISVEGSLGDTLNIRIANGDEAYLADDFTSDFDIGQICLLEIGLMTSSGMVWQPYEKCIISSVKLEYPSRRTSLDLVQEGMWRVSNASYPFYLEISSKGAYRDEINGDLAIGNLEPKYDESGIPEKLSVDFWQDKNGYFNGGLSPGYHGPNASKTYWSGDLKSRFATAYPIVDVFPFTAHIYGWSRAGVPSTNPNTADSTPTDSPNDNFQLTFIVKAQTVGSSERTVTIPLASKSSTYNYPSQTWFTENVRDGSLPVSYSITSADGISLNDQIIQIGVIAVSTANTTMHIERVEIPDLFMYVLDASPKVSVENTPDLTRVLWDFNEGAQGWYWYVVTWDGMYGTSDTGGLRIISTRVWSDAWMTGSWRFDVPTPNLYVGLESSIRFKSSWISTKGSVAQICITLNGGTELVYSAGGSTGDGITIQELTYPIDPAYFNRYVTRISFQVGNWASTNGNFFLDEFELVDFNTSLYSRGPDSKSIKVTPRGSPIIFESQAPYTAWNFEETVDIEFSGTGNQVGLIGLETDDKNYVAIRVSTSKTEFIKVRAGRETVLKSQASSVTSPAIIYLSHRDGYFEARIKSISYEYPAAYFDYRWTEADGPMVIDTIVTSTSIGSSGSIIGTDNMHVGIYTNNDTPKFRICGFGSSGIDGIGILPGYDSSCLADFPASGEIIIDNTRYTYSGKQTIAGDLRGPFQLRNLGDRSAYNNPSDGTAFAAGPALEMTMFQWVDGATHKNDYAGWLLSSSGRYNWLIRDTDWRVNTVTGGAIVWLLNRSKFFCANASGGSNSDKTYVTKGLTGIVAVEDIGFHSEGSYCYLYEEGGIYINGFAAANGYNSVVIEDIMDKICSLAGAKAVFPGDITPANETLTANVAWSVA